MPPDRTVTTRNAFEDSSKLGQRKRWKRDARASNMHAPDHKPAGRSVSETTVFFSA